MSTSARPQDGHAINTGPRSRSPRAFRISNPAFTSSSGGAASDTRIVSPIPRDRIAPRPTADLTVPPHAVPDSVMPTWIGYGICCDTLTYASSAISTSLPLTDTTMSRKSRSSRTLISSSALSTSASAHGSPYLRSISFEIEPTFAPDANRDAPRLGFAGDDPHAVGLPDVAGIEAQLVDARLERGEREPVVEVNVGDQRQPDPRLDLPQRGRGGLVGHGHPHDLAPERLEPLDLRDRGVGVARVGGRHRLHGDRCPAADRHAADLHLTRLRPVHAALLADAAHTLL